MKKFDELLTGENSNCSFADPRTPNNYGPSMVGNLPPLSDIISTRIRYTVDKTSRAWLMAQYPCPPDVPFLMSGELGPEWMVVSAPLEVAGRGPAE